MFHQVITIACAIIIGVAVEENKEYSNLPRGIWETTQRYTKCLKHWAFPLTHFSYYSFNATLTVMTKVIVTCW